MVPARLLHPHRAGHLPAQHADTSAILDNRTRPLTTRHWIAQRRPQGDLDAAGRERDNGSPRTEAPCRAVA
jgi:hypothetical protein